MSNRNELVSEILGNTEVKKSNYPTVCWTQVDGNAFGIIGQAQKAWRAKDKEVSARIGKVLMSKAESYDVLLGVCIELCPMASDDEDEDDLA
jgi:hypothetical protein